MRGRGAKALGTVLAAAAVLCGLFGLDGFLDGTEWAGSVVAVVGAATGAAAAARLLTRSAVLPTAAGLVVGVWALVVAYVPSADGTRTLVPTPAALIALRDLMDDGIVYAAQTLAPAPVVPELGALLAAGALAMMLAVDALAVGAGLAATSGLLLLTPWLPAFAIHHRAAVLPLAGAVVCWTGLLGLARRADPAPGRRTTRVAVGTAAGAGAVAVAAAAVFAPLGPAVPGWGALPQVDVSSGQAATRLSLDVDLRRSLTEQSRAEVLAYSTEDGRLDVLKTTTLADFDGSEWAPGPTGPPEPLTGLLWPEQVAVGVGTPASVRVAVLALDVADVPLPDSPRTVSDVSGTYDAVRDELSVDSAGGADQLIYAVNYLRDFHTADALLEAQQAIADGGDAAVDAAYLDLAPAIDVDRVRTLAAERTADAGTRYAQAVALQEWLSGPEFDYSPAVAFDGDDAVSLFLDTRVGYCSHFATTMVVMARTLDIPARLALGFLGGRAPTTDTGWYYVTGQDYHAWPELYFPGHGWVRFEPTPAVQTGPAPEYASPEEAAPEQSATPSPEASAATADPTPSALPEEPADASDAASPVLTRGAPLVAALVAAALLAAGGATAWMVTRARRRGLEQVWAAVVRRLIGDGAALTPAETVARVERLRDLDEPQREALARLAAAVEDYRYAPGGTEPTRRELDEWRRALRRTRARATEAAATGTSRTTEKAEDRG